MESFPPGYDEYRGHAMANGGFVGRHPLAIGINAYPARRQSPRFTRQDCSRTTDLALTNAGLVCPRSQYGAEPPAAGLGKPADFLGLGRSLRRADGEPASAMRGEAPGFRPGESSRDRVGGYGASDSQRIVAFTATEGGIFAFGVEENRSSLAWSGLCVCSFPSFPDFTSIYERGLSPRSPGE